MAEANCGMSFAGQMTKTLVLEALFLFEYVPSNFPQEVAGTGRNLDPADTSLPQQGSTLSHSNTTCQMPPVPKGRIYGRQLSTLHLL